MEVGNCWGRGRDEWMCFRALCIVQIERLSNSVATVVGKEGT